MKIPFERTIAGAYRFVFANIGSVVGIVWFPFLLLGVFAFGLLRLLLPHLHGVFKAAADKTDPSEIMPYVLPATGGALLLVAAVIILMSMVQVGIMRKALGQHPGPVYFFFSLGAQVRRMIGAHLLVLVLAYGVVLALALGIGVVSFLLSRISAPVQVIATVLLTCAAMVWGIYAAVRLQFFLPAVVVAEDHIGIRRSWHLGRQNFWRIIGIVILIALPATIVLSVIFTALIPFSLAAQVTPQMTPEQVREMLTTAIRTTRHLAPVIVALELLYMIVMAGLTAGAIATAYLLVTTGEANAVPPSGPLKAPA
jgi:hypothetical protein